ncbi:UNVERIFIED_CONTAM: hypothetical protein NCL1_12084 [Trichonephila clavipes]
MPKIKYIWDMIYLYLGHHVSSRKVTGKRSRVFNAPEGKILTSTILISREMKNDTSNGILLFKLSHHTNERTLRFDRFNIQQLL